MNLGWTIAGSVAGLLAGAALNGVVVRMSVPFGEQFRTTCPQCAAPLPRMMVIRCATCHRRLGPFPLLELATGAAVGALAGRFAGTPEVAAFCVLGAVGIALAAIDLNVQRLPDKLTLPAYPSVLVLLAAAAVIGHHAWPLTRAVLGRLSLGGLGWRAVLDGAALGFLLAGMAGLMLLAARRVTLRSHISFGPFLIGGALLAMLAAGPGPAG